MGVNETLDVARQKSKQYMYYFLIGLASLITLIFLPMVGSTAGIAWAVPTTVVGWIVWVAVKLIVAALNVMIFHCFIMQGKTNIKNHPSYIEAKEILKKCSNKELIPESPQHWTKRTYGQKGVSILITTALGTFALSQAILTFDWILMITYLFTIAMGIIFGILQMKSTEEWWTENYLEYAKYIEKKQNEQNDNNSTVTLTEEQYVDNTITLLEANNDKIK